MNQFFKRTVVIAASSSLLLAGWFSVLAVSSNAQELIGPGQVASELPTPNLSSNSNSGDPLQEYRQTLEDHLLKKERAKLEARARFESRSLDLVPAPTPPKVLSGSGDSSEPDTSELDARLRELRAQLNNGPQPQNTSPDLIQELPAPLPTTESAEAPFLEEDGILSPSDRTRQPEPNMEDLLGPPLPAPTNERSIEPERKLPAPLRPRKSIDRPQTLGGGTNGDDDNPFRRSREFDSSVDNEIKKFEPIPPGTRKKSWPSTDAVAKPEPNKAADAARPPAADRAASQKNDVSKRPRSVLQSLPHPDDTDWRSLVRDENRYWATPASFRPNTGIASVHCSTCGGCVDRKGRRLCDKFGVMVGVGTRERPKCQCWRCPHQAPFNTYGVGGYVGPARSAPVAAYRLRSGDQIQLTFLIKTVRTVGSYRLVVGDELLVESDADANLTRGTLERGLEIQPDGTITLRFIGQVHAAGQTIEQLRDLLNDRYEEYYPDPAIDVTPVQTGNVARQIREAISGSEGFNPQQASQTVTPEGTIRLPRLGAIPTQGLTMDELKREINLRYESLGAGLEVEVVLEQQATHFIYVLGEVGEPGRFEITSPTTVLGGLSLAQGYVPGANLRQVVIFRRGANWELVSTVLDLRAALFAKASRPADEIWLQDGDVVIVPPTPIQVFDRFVQQVFTDGIYGAVPAGVFDTLFGNNNDN